jgi:hypothetical protein
MPLYAMVSIFLMIAGPVTAAPAVSGSSPEKSMAEKEIRPVSFTPASAGSQAMPPLSAAKHPPLEPSAAF